jgi:filamentous hemagglutinin family protein
MQPIRPAIRSARRLAGFSLVLAASTALVVPCLHAEPLPTGASVAAGGVSVGSTDTSMTITQSTSQAIVNWSSFSVGLGYSVEFVQPDASSAILNRVTGDTASTIAGAVTGNGQVFLINPNGIAITATGTVAVGGGFVASTLDIADDDFLDGDLRFEGDGSSAGVTNAGVVTVGRGGYAALIGGTVKNDGLVAVPLGRIGLGSGEQATLDLSGDGFLQVALPTAAGAEGDGALIENAGTLRADGGTVVMRAATAREAARQAINMSGVVEARSVGGTSGAIVLGGGEGGSVRISGRLDATGTATVASLPDVAPVPDARPSGGSIEVTGQAIALAGATLDASGAGGGGTVKLGGDWQGTGDTQRAGTTTVDAGTIIRADATVDGDGGTVVVWSDDLTTFAGLITARGAGAGSGGDAEVSGKAVLAYSGFADLSSAGGTFGTLLLDPYDITISNGSASNASGTTATGNDSVINVGTLEAALAGANVTITTGADGSAGSQAGDITVADSITWSAATTLTLSAYRNIAVDADIAGANGGVVLRADNSGTGAGTVTFGAGAGLVTSEALGARIYYNPTSYAAPTDFSGADGGGGIDAYMLVNTAENLQAISTNLAGTYALGRDIDASGTAEWDDGKGFVPIGTGTDQFTGTLDGQGHVVSGLYINRTGGIGLFGYVGTSGTITRIGVVDASVVSTLDDVGLLAAYNYGSITASYATGSVSTARSFIGGLVGRNFGTIDNSYATATVSGAGRLGGLVGYNSGTITDSYATGTVTGSTQWVGGLVGVNAAGASIERSYSSGGVGGTQTAVGGLVGSNSGTVSASYWDMDTSGQSSGIGEGSTTGATGLTSAQARSSDSYTGWDFSTVWYQAGDMRPILRSEAATADDDGVITVSNLHQLALIGANLAASYVLTRDIDASATDASTESFDAAGIWSAAGWVPIGTRLASFSGTLDGAGHTISGLSLDRTTTYAGLFGYVDTSGSITDLSLEGGRIVSSGSDVGALAGYSAGTIAGSISSASVGGSTHVGGLVGYNAGSISSSSASGAVGAAPGITYVSSAGGLVGSNDGTISDSFATGAVSGSSNVGGLVGYFDSGTITGSYATGAVTGTSSYAGGLVGGTGSESLISDSYATGRVSGSYGTGGLVGYHEGEITHSYAAGDVVATSSNTGGLVGVSSGKISYAYATGNVSGLQYSGGLVGYLSSTATVTEAYASGDVQAPSYVGGFVGSSAGSISNAYALGDVGGTSYVGGFAGELTGSVTGAYSSGKVTGTSSVGGFAGRTSSAVIASSFFDRGTSGQTLGIGTGTVGTGGSLTGLTTAEARTSAGYAGWDFSTVWYQAGDMRPILRSEAAEADADGVIAIANLHQLALMGADLSASYLLTSDIDATPTDAEDEDYRTSGIWGDGGWVPIGTRDAAFTGSLDGDGHTISNLTIDYQVDNVGYTAHFVGLFGYLGSGSSIGDLTLADASITTNAQIGYFSIVVGGAEGATITQVHSSGTLNGNGNLGGLVGYAKSTTIEQSSSTATVTARSQRVGGLVGYLDIGSTIKQSYAAGAVSSTGVGDAGLGVGGLVGLAVKSTIEQSYATGSATSDESSGVGGLVGIADRATITQTYATGAVSASDDFGGLIGRRENSTVTSSYFDTETTGVSNGVGDGVATGITGLTTAQMQTKSSFAGWNFGTVWYLGAGAYPVLRALEDDLPTSIQITITADAKTRTYGEANPALTWQITDGALLDGDSVTGALATSATITSGVGTYAITQGTLAIEGDYAIDFVGATLTIQARAITITADDLSRTYGDANPDLTWEVTDGSLVNGDTLSGALSTTATTASGVGMYDVTQGTLTNANYAVTFEKGTLTVDKRAITVTADDKTRAYGDANPALTWTVTEGTLAKGDTLSGALSTDATVQSGVDGYDIVQGTLAASSNYEMSFEAGTLTVNQRAITITADDKSRTYGDANPELTWTVSEGDLVNGDTLSGTLSTEATALSGVGDYAIAQGTLDDANYAITFEEGTLTVNRRAITVTADDGSKIYGDANPHLTWSITDGDLVNGDALSGDLATEVDATTSVGSYDIGQGTLAASDNYELTYETGTLTVERRAVTITADDQSRLFGFDNPALSWRITAGDLVNGDAVSGVLSTDAEPLSLIGTYAIEQGTLGLSPNYDLSFVAGTIAVTPVPADPIGGRLPPAFVRFGTSGAGTGGGPTSIVWLASDEQTIEAFAVPADACAAAQDLTALCNAN